MIWFCPIVHSKAAIYNREDSSDLLSALRIFITPVLTAVVVVAGSIKAESTL